MSSYDRCHDVSRVRATDRCRDISRVRTTDAMMFREFADEEKRFGRREKGNTQTAQSRPWVMRVRSCTVWRPQPSISLSAACRFRNNEVGGSLQRLDNTNGWVFLRRKVPRPTAAANTPESRQSAGDPCCLIYYRGSVHGRSRVRASADIRPSPPPLATKGKKKEDTACSRALAAASATH